MVTCYFERKWKDPKNPDAPLASKFIVLDTYIFGKDKYLNTFALDQRKVKMKSDHTMRALITYNGSKFIEVPIGGDDTKQTRLILKIKHSFNFNMKAS